MLIRKRTWRALKAPGQPAPRSGCVNLASSFRRRLSRSVHTLRRGRQAICFFSAACFRRKDTARISGGASARSSMWKRGTAVNVLAVARQHLGSLDRVTRVVRLGVSVATSGDVPARRKDKSPCRLVYGVASLPLGTPVELEVIFEVTE